MKFNLKMIAAAAAMVATGAASAATSAWNTGNGSLILYAYNTATTGYYYRDLGPLINDFLPNSIGPVAGDNPLAGTRTPEAGVSNLTFAGDQTFTDWAGSASTILWGVAAGDSLSAGPNGVSRLVYSSSITPAPTNAQITTATGGSSLGGVANNTPAGGSVSFASGVGVAVTSNGGIGAANLTAIGANASLFYFTRTAQSGGNATAATPTLFQNSANVATITLLQNGNVVYNLAAAAPVSEVPLPAAAWLLGAGLMGIGGFVRRRKAAAEA